MKKTASKKSASTDLQINYRPLESFPVSTIAKLFHLTERRVQQLAKGGVIPRAERGKYELAGCVQGYVKYLQACAYGMGVEPTELHAERTRLLKAQADKMEIEVAKIEGALIPADQVVLAWQQLVAAARAKFLALPSRLAPQLAGNHDIQAIKEAITEAVREALEELSRFRLADISKTSDPPGGIGSQAARRLT